MKVFPEYLPTEFGVLILTLALILALSPYISGHDFGKIKIPNFSAGTKSLLKWIGPIALIIAILLHLPILPKPCTEPVYETVTDIKQCGTVAETYEVTPAAVNSCRDKSFGVESWANVQRTSGNSGWMSGGHSQSEWCNSLIASFISGNKIGPEHISEVISSSEDADWTGIRHREYNYSCTVEISWNPIYKAKVDKSVCGITPAVMGARDVPATCKVQIGTREVDCGA